MAKVAKVASMEGLGVAEEARAMPAVTEAIAVEELAVEARWLRTPGCRQD